MKYKQLGNKVLIRVDKGEELVDALKQICKTLDIYFGSLVGIGATDNVAIGLLNTTTKKYQTTQFTGDHEISSLMGNITRKDGEVFLHLHATICNAEHSAFGGHLTSAVISATFEGIIEIVGGNINRTFNQSVGLNVLQF